MSVQNTSGSVEQKTWIKGNVQKNTIIWTIPKFMKILNNKDVKEIRAPNPKLTQPDESKFQLMMKFLGVDNNWIEIYYSTSKSIVLESVQVNIFGSLDRWSDNDQQHEYRVDVSKKRQIVEANQWQYLTYLSADLDIHCVNKIYYEHNCNILLLQTNGSICLTFYFVVEDDKKDPLVSISSLAQTQSPVTQMIRDLENLFNDSIYSDVLMKSADNEEFKVHKGMLASRSPVFKALFEHNFSESTTNIVESPLESAVLREVLLFIYTDRAPKVDDFPEKLLAAADYYQLSELKSHCEVTLQKKLNIDNAIETLQIADLYKANTLKQRILEFIKYIWWSVKTNY